MESLIVCLETIPLTNKCILFLCLPFFIYSFFQFSIECALLTWQICICIAKAVKKTCKTGIFWWNCECCLLVQNLLPQCWRWNDNFPSICKDVPSGFNHIARVLWLVSRGIFRLLLAALNQMGVMMCVASFKSKPIWIFSPSHFIVNWILIA